VVTFAGAVANECKKCRMELRRWFIAACRKEIVLAGIEMRYIYKSPRKTVQSDRWHVWKLQRMCYLCLYHDGMQPYGYGVRKKTEPNRKAACKQLTNE
jgi:hypothetical protein